jgi:rubredoxin
MHPCSNCHTWTKSDLTPRKLKKPHDNFELKHGLHGKGKFWCFTCHTLDGRGGLRTLEGQKLDFNEAYVLCSQCHVQETRDWVFGAHGKRVANWQGERQVYNCTVCHYQHDPAIGPRAALAGPVVRQGLERPDHWTTMTSRGHGVFETERVWERYAEADPGDRR